MTGWIVFGSILLLLSLLLFSPVSVRVYADKEQLSIRARYLFLSINLSPDALAKRAEKKKAKPPKEKKPKAEAEPAEEKKKPKKDTLQTVLDFVKSSRKGLRTLRRHLVFSKVGLYLSVGAEDAHQAAIRYSQYCMLVSGLLDVVGVLFVLRKPQIVILPDFLRDGLRYEASVRVSIRPAFVLAAGASIFYRFFRAQLSKKSKPRAPVTTQKAS